MIRVVAVSGGFDPLHSGHIKYLKAAKELGGKGNYVMAILNSDDWLIRKKGYVFMPYEEREELLLALKYVDEVVPSIDFDDSVCYSLEIYKPDIFAKGGDRTQENIPELTVCIENGIDLEFGVGGEKVSASSDLVERLLEQLRGVEDDTEDGLYSSLKK